MSSEKTRYIRVGIFATVIMAASIIGLKFLKGDAPEVETYPIFLIVKDARNIEPTTAIMYQGKQIGWIRNFELMDYSTGLMMTLAIKKDFQIPKSAIFSQKKSMDNKFEIDVKFDNRTAPFVEVKDTILLN